MQLSNTIWIKSIDPALFLFSFLHKNELRSTLKTLVIFFVYSCFPSTCAVPPAIETRSGIPGSDGQNLCHSSRLRYQTHLTGK